MLIIVGHIPKASQIARCAPCMPVGKRVPFFQKMLQPNTWWLLLSEMSQPLVHQNGFVNFCGSLICFLMRCLDLTGLWFATCNTPHIELGKLFYPHCSNGWGHYWLRIKCLWSWSSWYLVWFKCKVCYPTCWYTWIRLQKQYRTSKMHCIFECFHFLIFLNLCVRYIFFSWWFCSFPTYWDMQFSSVHKTHKTTCSYTAWRQYHVNSQYQTITQRWPTWIHCSNKPCRSRELRHPGGYFQWQGWQLQGFLHVDENIFGNPKEKMDCKQLCILDLCLMTTSLEVFLWNLESALLIFFPNKNNCYFSLCTDRCVYLNPVLGWSTVSGGETGNRRRFVWTKKTLQSASHSFAMAAGKGSHWSPFMENYSKMLGLLSSWKPIEKRTSKHQTWWDSKLSEVWTMFGKIL